MNEAIEIHFVRGYKFDDCVVNCKSTKINKFKSLLLEYISQKYIELFVIRVFYKLLYFENDRGKRFKFYTITRVILFERIMARFSEIL